MPQACPATWVRCRRRRRTGRHALNFQLRDLGRCRRQGCRPGLSRPDHQTLRRCESRNKIRTRSRLDCWLGGICFQGTSLLASIASWGPWIYNELITCISTRTRRSAPLCASQERPSSWVANYCHTTLGKHWWSKPASSATTSLTLPNCWPRLSPRPNIPVSAADTPIDGGKYAHIVFQPTNSTKRSTELSNLSRLGSPAMSLPLLSTPPTRLHSTRASALHNT